MIGATAGRTTLNGEGLQHQDGHSHMMAAAIPNCISYDPTYAYELAVIVQDGMKRMFEAGEKCFYYITTMNENYRHPDMPEDVEEGIIRGLYQIKTSTGTPYTPCAANGCGSHSSGSGSGSRDIRNALQHLRGYLEYDQY